MNKFIKIPYLVLLALLFACSDSDNDIVPEPDPTPIRPIVEIKISSDKESCNIFDRVQFTLMTEDGKTIYWGLDLFQYYDSIVWEIPNVGRAKLTDTSDDIVSRYYTSVTLGWGHDFFVPQKVKTFLLCYQGDSIAYQTFNTISIKNDKDFLKFNWGDIKKSEKMESYIDFFEYNKDQWNSNFFSTQVGYENEIPSVSLIYSNNKKSDDGAKICKDKLYSLITELYGLPTYDKSNQELLTQQYTELFNTEEELVPCNIWITPISIIVLASRDYPYFPYIVYAEPR